MKIIASDYDGTIKLDGVTSERTIKALYRWVEKGHVFGIVTGRSYEGFMYEQEQYHLPYSFLIGDNGSIIFDANHEVLFHKIIDASVAASVIEDLRHQDILRVACNDGFKRANEFVHAQEIDLTYGPYDLSISVDDLVREGHVTQIVASLDSIEKAKRLAAYLNETYDGFIHAFQNRDTCDVVPYGVSKATGLDFVETYYGYAHEDIIALGDAPNDLPMLTRYHNATVENAFDIVKEQCEFVEKDVADIVYHLLKD